jgi:solute carrier family 45 protein 1/2/4
MTYCTPYLLELGLTKSKISLVWVAGPISGLIMQPIVGVVADRSTSRWGRRRPFMFFGTILVAMFLLLLGWTKEVVRYFIKDEEAAKSATIYLAVFSIYGIDFAINAVQGSCRGLVVDTLPIAKQQMGSSWASRMVAVGSLIGYGAGAIDLKNVLGPMLGDTQFKQLTGIAALTLCLAIGTTSWAVTERVLITDGTEDGDKLDIKQVLGTIVHTALNLPRSIQAICYVQFWAWIGKRHTNVCCSIPKLTTDQAGFLSSSTAQLGLAKSTYATMHLQMSRRRATSLARLVALALRP